ncbi:hypothetical protein SAMN05421809_1880 [Natronorubrum daqingense]|uniref:DUF7344 domain-containing protein n=1 Tax=Natronorubrum daqingense TaxID=588898 RepID=A0A1N7CUA9_9EURY|nr:hypothetical protein SAMN05421809_1880 [Natronorubrum daqingense]
MAHDKSDGSSTDGGCELLSSVDGGTETYRRLGLLLDVLSNCHRRFALYYLLEHEVATVEELTQYLLREYQERPSLEHGGGDFDAVHTALVHGTLPKLAGAGIVEYDTRSQMVRYRRCYTELPPLLAACATLEGVSVSVD